MQRLVGSVSLCLSLVVGCATAHTPGTLLADGGHALGCVEVRVRPGADDDGALAQVGDPARDVLVEITVGNACRDAVTLRFDTVRAWVDQRGGAVTLMPIAQRLMAPAMLDADAQATEVLAFRTAWAVAARPARICVSVDGLTEHESADVPICFWRHGSGS